MEVDATTQLITEIAETCRHDMTAMLTDQSDLVFTTQDLCRKMFLNFRNHDGKFRGLRLTQVGSTAMKKHFDAYKHEVDWCRLRGSKRIIINLDRHMQWPYYLSNHALVLFNEMDNAIYQLSGGDLSYFSENC